MAEKIFPRVLVALPVALLIAGCSKGLDAPLDFSNATNFGASYAEAMQSAPEPQRQVMQARLTEVALRVTGTMGSAADGKSEAASSLVAMKKMTARELVLHHLGLEKASVEEALPALELFASGKGLVLEDIVLTDVPTKLEDDPLQATLRGKLRIRNASTSFDYDMRGCNLTLALGEADYGEPDSACKSFEVVPAGKSIEYPFEYYLKRGPQLTALAKAVNAGQAGIALRARFSPSGDDSYLKARTGQVVTGAGGKELAASKTRLEAIKRDIETMKAKS